MFRESGYDESMAIECPYVLQYADFSGISLQQAADDILLKSKFDRDLLMKTELLRLKFFRRIKEAQKPEEVALVIRDFFNDYYTS